MFMCLTREERVDLLAYYTVEGRKAAARKAEMEQQEWMRKHGGKAGAMAVDAHRSGALVKALRKQGTSDDKIRAFLRSGEDGGMSRR